MKKPTLRIRIMRLEKRFDKVELALRSLNERIGTSTDRLLMGQRDLEQRNFVLYKATQDLNDIIGEIKKVAISAATLSPGSIPQDPSGS